MEANKEINWMDYYTVTKDGRVFNIKRGNQLKSAINDKGYYYVILSIKGKCYYKRVHRLVAEKYIPNPENKPQVNHKDRNRQNPHLDNLEWTTVSENIRHSVANGGRKNWTHNNTGERNGRAILSWKIICAVRELYLNRNYSQNDLAEIFKISQGRISQIVNHKIWKSQN